MLFSVPSIMTARYASSIAIPYSTITIDHTKAGSTDSTDFTLLFKGTYSFLKTEANGGSVKSASGYDITFYSDSSLTTLLDFEIRRWNDSTGEIIAWVRIPTLSSSSNTLIYLSYGDPTKTTDLSNAAGVYDSNYYIVSHMDESGTLLDVKGNVNWTLDSGTKQVTSPTGYGVDVLDSAPSYLYTDTGHTTISSSAAFTISFWYQTHLTSGNVTVIAAARVPFKNIFTFSNLYLLPIVGNIADGRDPGTDTDPHLWHIRWDGTNFYIEIDGVNLISYGAAGSMGTGSSFIQFNQASDPASGTVSEIRYSDSCRSIDRSIAEYNNQFSPSTFYSI